MSVSIFGNDCSFQSALLEMQMNLRRSLPAFPSEVGRNEIKHDKFVSSSEKDQSFIFDGIWRE